MKLLSIFSLCVGVAILLTMLHSGTAQNFVTTYEAGFVGVFYLVAYSIVGVVHAFWHRKS